MKPFFLSFVTLFLAIDPLGLIPIYIQLTQGDRHRGKTLNASVVTAFGIGLGFLVVGKWLFKAVGITIADFQVAGGVLLLALSLKDLLSTPSPFHLEEDQGVVPLGTPLIAGPATLTALLVCQGLYGFWITTLAFLINLLLMFFILSRCGLIMDVVGARGTKAIARVTSILLAAFAVSFIRKGVTSLLGGLGDPQNHHW